MQVAAILATAGSYFYNHKGKAMGSINMGLAVGAFIGPVFGTKLTVATNNWHTPFIFYAVLGLIFMALVWLILPKTFTEAQGPSSHSHNIFKANVPMEFWNRNVLLVCISIACFGLSGYAVLGLFITYMIKLLKFDPMVASVGMGFLV